jgi:hypothetical protein
VKRAAGNLRLVTREDEKKEEKKGDPVIAARFRAVRVELGIKRQADLYAMMQEAAKKNAGRTGAFDQTYISRLETGVIKADTLHVHSAYAAALGLTRDEWADYIDGVMHLEEVRRLYSARRAAKPGPRTLRRLPNWETLKTQALALDPDLRASSLEAIADTAITGPAERVTPMRVAVMAAAAQAMGGDE